MSRWLTGFHVALRSVIRRRRVEEELDEEFQYHLERQINEGLSRGLAPQAARDAALRAMGAIEKSKEECRDLRSANFVSDFVGDLRYAGRALRRSPGFTAVALVTLALGIGANIAIFSVVNGVILRPLVYPRPEQLMRLTAQFPVLGSTGVGLSNPEYEEFRAMNRSFAHVGAFTVGSANTGGGAGSWSGEVNLTAGDRALRVRSAAVDDHLLRALGVQPAHGRFFAAGETDAMADRPGLGGAPIAILSHELWQTAFGGHPIVGRTVNVDGRLHDVMKQGLQATVIGIVVGVAGAVGVNRLIATLLFGVRPTDPTTFAAVIIAITLVAAIASWLPAWRASRLDPNVVLRAE